MILFDSSVWVAYFHKRDAHHQKAVHLVSNSFQNNEQIIVPEFVYAEVLNSVWRLTQKEQDVYFCKRVFLQGSPLIQLELGGSIFWFHVIEQTMMQVNLKTSDLIVASSAVFYQVQRFETFDEKLRCEMKKIIL
ncbi:MAG: type II toxin-antitoxin system VapC family toxin [Ignavibacteriae bacterium]|nr:type II toxin-antitoxin system VapC family toxin [Ignavibacteriota bacterium]